MDNRLTEIKALCDAATPGPWYADGFIIINLLDNSPQNSDRSFIAIARELLPAYVATGLTPEQITAMAGRVEQLEAENAQLRDGECVAKCPERIGTEKDALPRNCNTCAEDCSSIGDQPKHDECYWGDWGHERWCHWVPDMEEQTDEQR